MSERFILLKFFSRDENGKRVLSDSTVVPTGGASFPVRLATDAPGQEGDNLECWAEEIT